MSEKWISLVSLLIRLTRDGLLKWEETSDPDAFQTNLQDVTIEVELLPAMADYQIRIIGPKGKTVDTFGDAEMRSLTNDTWFGEMETLVNTIRRRLSGADQVLDKLLKLLQEKEDEIPF